MGRDYQRTEPGSPSLLDASLKVKRNNAHGCRLVPGSPQLHSNASRCLKVPSSRRCARWAWNKPIHGGSRVLIRRQATPRDTPIWKLEAALKCRSCKEAVSFPHTDDDSDYNDHNRYGHPILDLSAKDAECLNEDMQGPPPLGLASFYLQMIAPPLLPLDASKCAVRAACRATRPLWKALDRWKRLGLGLASMAALPGR